MSTFSGAWRHQKRRDPTRTATFQTVSPHSTLAIWPPGRRHRSRVPCYSLDFLRLGAHSQPAKSLLTSWERPPHTRSGVRVPEGGVDQQGGAKRSLRKVLSGPRELRGALRDRRIEVSSSGGWSRGVPYLFR